MAFLLLWLKICILESLSLSALSLLLPNGCFLEEILYA